jgi:hypothetical protein
MCLLNMQPENFSTNKKNRKILKRVCSGVCVLGGGGGGGLREVPEIDYNIPLAILSSLSRLYSTFMQ